MSMVKLLFLTWFFCATAANAAVYPMPRDEDDIVGKMQTVKVESGDNSTTIRQRNEISYHELLEANQNVNFNKLRVGQEITIPSVYVLPPYRSGIVVNTAELRLYYFTPDGRYVFTYPVGLGRQNWRTPTTITKVVNKVADPTWYVPDSIRNYMFKKTGKLLPDFIPPGPDNPLGKYALYLAKRGYLIHGTTQPDSVGTYASSGCMRMSADAIETLYNYVPIGAPVYIIHHTNKAGWQGNTLYLESHTPIGDLREKHSVLNHVPPEDALKNATARYVATVDWDKVKAAVNIEDGIPKPVGKAAIYGLKK